MTRVEIDQNKKKQYCREFAQFSVAPTGKAKGEKVPFGRKFTTLKDFSRISEIL